MALMKLADEWPSALREPRSIESSSTRSTVAVLNAVSGACLRLSSHRSRAIFRGSIFRSCHQSDSLVVWWRCWWWVAHNGTVNSSLTFSPNPRGCACRR